MGLQGSFNARWAKLSRVFGGQVVVDAPFLRTISWRVPPLYEAWLGNTTRSANARTVSLLNRMLAIFVG